MVLESRVVGATTDEECADVLVVGPGVAGVVDGATPKPWDPPGSPSGRELAIALAAYLTELDRRATAHMVVQSATSLIAHLLGKAGVSPGHGSAASFAVVHLGRREVWRVGEAHVLIDGRLVSEATAAEQIVAHARALVLHAHLRCGASADDLRHGDPGRRAVEPLLRALATLRNSNVHAYRNVAIDGRVVPEAEVDVIALPERACAVVIASDGYPRAAANLADSEVLLAERLARDPLLIEDPPATKGWLPGTQSFDDRCYVRVALPPAVGA